MSAEPIVDIQGVSKAFDGTLAVDGATFSVPAGAIYGVLGPNGAGKTTTIRMVMRILLPDRGRCVVFGDSSVRVDKSRIGYLPEERGLYKKMRVADQLAYFARIKGLSGAEAKRRTAEWLERLDLAESATKKAEELSKGMQQKAQFIGTILHEPDLLILDEPFSGLDPVNTEALKDIILEYHRRGHTIIFSTHMMDQVDRLCDHVCLFNRGRVVLDGALAGVKRRFGTDGLTLGFSGDGAFLSSLPGVTAMNDYGNEVFLRLTGGADPMAILDAARDRLAIHRFEIATPSIRDIFISQVSESAGDTTIDEDTQ